VNLFDQIINDVLSNPVLVGFLLVAFLLICLAKFTEALKKIRDFVSEAFTEKDKKNKKLISQQLESRPPFYGNSIDGNVRPQMEVYIQSFPFPEGSVPEGKARLLLRLIEERRNPDKPKEYFKADSEFRAEMDRFIYSAREFIA